MDFLQDGLKVLTEVKPIIDASAGPPAVQHL